MRVLDIRFAIPRFGQVLPHSSVPTKDCAGVARSGRPGRPKGRREAALPWTGASTAARLRLFDRSLRAVVPLFVALTVSSAIAVAEARPARPIANYQTGDPFASFLLGLPNEETLSISSVIPRWNQNYYAAYVQDDFKLRKDLTINLGLRYDVDTPRHEAHGAQSVLDLTAQNCGNAAVPISPCVPGALIYGPNATGAKTYFKDIGPRIGFAYSPAMWGNRTVLRGGCCWERARHRRAVRRQPASRRSA